MNVFNGILIPQDVRGVGLVIPVIGLRRQDYRQSAALFLSLRPIKDYHLFSLIAFCYSYRLGLSTRRRWLLDRQDFANVQIYGGNRDTPS